MSRHVLTIAEMTAHLASRDDIKPAVKAKILAGESCTSLPGADFLPLLAVATYAERRWADIGTKAGMPNTQPPVAQPAAAPLRAKAGAAPATPEARFVHEGVTLTIAQLKAKVKADEIGDFERVRRVGSSELEQIRNLPELRDASPVLRSPAAVVAPPPVPAPRAPAVAGSSILRNFHRGQRHELDGGEPELSPFRRVSPARSVPAGSEPEAAAPQTHLLPPSRIAARAQQLALEAHRAEPTEPGPDAA